MNAGMLWSLSKDAPLQTAVAAAVVHYIGKYSVQPTVCYVHPLHLEGQETITIEAIILKSSITLQPGVVWVEHPEGFEPRQADTQLEGAAN